MDIEQCDKSGVDHQALAVIMQTTAVQLHASTSGRQVDGGEMKFGGRTGRK
jgi:hypothetical protein